ncbi:GNAT family N-acetyltransferase [Chloroflexota bacterium]
MFINISNEKVYKKTAIIRAAIEEDLPRILELYQELVITTSPAEIGRGPGINDYQKAFAQINTTEGYELLVAEEQGKIVGTMVLIIVPNLSHVGLPWAGIENVFVDSSYRRLGIGKLLMNYAETRAKECGCYKIQLISDKRREEAHLFYQSLGYEASGHGFRLYL